MLSVGDLKSVTERNCGLRGFNSRLKKINYFSVCSSQKVNIQIYKHKMCFSSLPRFISDTDTRSSTDVFLKKRCIKAAHNVLSIQLVRRFFVMLAIFNFSFYLICWEQRLIEEMARYGGLEEEIE